MQRSRRTNPYPFTWELPLVLVVAVLFLLLVGVQAGRSIANVIAGSGWVRRSCASSCRSRAYAASSVAMVRHTWART